MDPTPEGVRISSDGRPYARATMLFVLFVSLYAFCAALLLVVVWQDRHRATAHRDARDPRASHASEFVFRTQA